MAETALKGIRGRTKAAVLLGFLPMDLSQKIIGYLDNLEKEILVREVSAMPQITEEAARAVLTEYVAFVKGVDLTFNSGVDFARKLLDGAMPQGELNEMMDRIYLNTTRPFESIRRRLKDVGPLLSFLSNEDPQTIAVVVSHMKETQGAQLLQALPEDKMVAVAVAIANMDQTNREVLLRIEKHLAGKLENIMDDDHLATDGVKTLVGILNNASRSTEKALFEGLEQIDPRLTQVIKDNMFVFEDITTIDRMALQIVINKITDNELIAKALKTATEEMKECFYGAMAESRRLLVEDAAEGLRSVRKAEVEDAQQTIANIVKELEKEGAILIVRGENDDIIF